MAIVTTRQKLAMMNIGAPGGGIVLPDVGSSIDLQDKRHILGLYTGRAISSITTGIGMGFGGGIISSGARRPGRK